MNKKSKIILTIRILFALILVFVIGNGIAFYDTKNKIYEEADMVANKDVDYLLLYTDRLLGEAQVAAYNLRGLLDHESIKSDAVYDQIDTYLSVNPHVYGVAIAFEPDMVEANQIGIPATFTYGNKKEGYTHLPIKYNHLQAGWYKDTKIAGKPRWGTPIPASDGKLIAPFCLPLYDKNNNFMGVLATDISLEGLSQKLRESAPYEDAVVAMLTDSLKFMAHPNPDYVLNMSLDSLYSTLQTGANMEVYQDMKDGKRGKHNYDVNGTEHIVYYAPVEKAKWTLAIDCTNDDIYAQVDTVKRNMLMTMLIGVIFFIFVCWKLIQRMEQYEQAASQRATMQSELNIASKIQMAMIPKLYPAFPERKELDVCGFIKPAKSVGGDLYDYFIRDEKFFFCLGDVSGKGVPASLFMAVIRALFRNVSLHEDDPANIASALNHGLSQGNEMNMFCTMFIGALDLKTGHLDFCNAGHNAPVIRRIKDDGSIDVHYMQPKTNLAVGVFDGFPYQKEETVLRPGEALFLYTDGVTEAENLNQELFGEEATLKALADARAHNVRTAQDFVNAIYHTIEAYTSGAEQSDDITMLVVDYKGAVES